MISLHFTPPATEVVGSGETFDIETLDKVTYDLQMKIAKTSKVSISYDVQKVDELQAAKFMKFVKTYLDDPDTMLL